MTAPDGVLLRTAQVFFRDAEITGLPQHRVGRLGIAKSYRITSVFPHLTVLENVRVAVQGHARSFKLLVARGPAHRLSRARGGDPGHQGRIQFEGTPEALRKDPTIQQRFPSV